MPFKSKAQRRFMHAKHPAIAKRWEKETPPGKLPEKSPADAVSETQVPTKKPKNDKDMDD